MYTDTCRTPDTLMNISSTIMVSSSKQLPKWMCHKFK